MNRPTRSNPPDILLARNDLPIYCDPPAETEIAEAINKLKRDKAAGPDQIPPEALKADVPANALRPLFIRICFSSIEAYEDCSGLNGQTRSRMKKYGEDGAESS